MTQFGRNRHRDPTREPYLGWRHARSRLAPPAPSDARGLSRRRAGVGRRAGLARVAAAEEQVLKPIQDPNEMDLTIDAASSRVGLDATTMAQALASYVRSILSGDAPYDRFINGETNVVRGNFK